LIFYGIFDRIELTYLDESYQILNFAVGSDKVELKMIDFIFQVFGKMGYAHPLHPAITHLPVGLVAAAFIFVLVALCLSERCSRHCPTTELFFLHSFLPSQQYS
jgi:hypothetical protein